MELVRLEDVCYSGTSNISQKDIMMLDGSYPIYGASGFIKNINFYKSEKPYIAIVKDGSGVGKTMILPEKSSIIGTMQYIFPRDNIDIRYLYYAITSMDLSKYSTGIAIPHIYFKDYKKENLNLPNISEQVNIANKLDLMQKIIDLKQQQIEDLDKLIKSQFVAMFENNNYYISSLGKISKVITKGTTPTSIGFNFINNSEVNFIKIESIDLNGFFIKEKFASISKECNKKLKRSALEENDILFSIAGAIGRTAIVTKDILPANTNQAIAIIRVDNKELNNVFLESMLKSDFVIKQYNRKKQGVAQINLSLKDISELNIYIPPIKRQEQYTEFVKEINKQKIKIQKSLEEIKKMQTSLMNKYFG